MATFDAYTADAGVTLTKSVTAAGASVGDLTGATITCRVTNPSGVVENWNTGWTGLTASRVQFVIPSAAYFDEVGTWEWRIQYTLGGVVQSLDPITLLVGQGGTPSGSVPAAGVTLTRNVGAQDAALLTFVDADAETGRTEPLVEIQDSNAGTGPGLKIERTSSDGQAPPLILENESFDLNGQVLLATLDEGVVTPIIRKNQTLADGILEIIWGMVGHANAHYGNVSILRNTLTLDDQPFFRLIPAWTLGGTNIDMKGESDGATYDRWSLLFGRDTDRRVNITCPDSTPGYLQLGMVGIEVHPDQSMARSMFRVRYDSEDLEELKYHANYSSSGAIRTTQAFTSTLATPATAWSYTINGSRAYAVRVRAVGRKSDGTQRAVIDAQCCAYNTGAGAVIEGQAEVFAARSDATWVAQFAVSGNSLLFNVSGNTGAAETVYWAMQVEYQSIGTAA
jgi:hypothetical protein